MSLKIFPANKCFQELGLSMSLELSTRNFLHNKLLYTEPIRYISSSCFTWPNNTNDLAPAHAVISCHWVIELNSGKLCFFYFVSSKKSLFLFDCQYSMFWYKDVFCNVHQKFRFFKHLNEIFGLHFSQALPRKGSDFLLDDNDRPRYTITPHFFRNTFNGFHTNFRLVDEKHEYMISRVVSF